MPSPSDQLTLLGFLPPRSDAVKKIITRERVEEMKELWAKGDKRGAIERLRDMRYKLEGLERSIRVSHKDPKINPIVNTIANKANR